MNSSVLKIVARQLTVLLLLLAFACTIFLIAFVSARYQAERNLAELYRAKTEYYRLLNSILTDRELTPLQMEILNKGGSSRGE